LPVRGEAIYLKSPTVRHRRSLIHDKSRMQQRPRRGCDIVSRYVWLCPTNVDV
jgi:hypothetical protein